MHAFFIICPLRGGWTCLQHHITHAGGDVTFHHQGHGHLHLPSAHRGVCRHCPFQLPCHDSSVDVPHWYGMWQHLPDEALWKGPRMHHAPGQNAPGRRGTRRHSQHHPRTTRRWTSTFIWMVVRTYKWGGPKVVFEHLSSTSRLFRDEKFP